MPKFRETDQSDMLDDRHRPPKATVGSYRVEEEIFGKVFDGKVLGRIWQFVKPYKIQMFIAVAAVLVFTGTQLLIPLIVRYAIDNGMTPDGIDQNALLISVGLFALVILIN